MHICVTHLMLSANDLQRLEQQLYRKPELLYSGIEATVTISAAYIFAIRLTANKLKDRVCLDAAVFREEGDHSFC